MGDLKTLGDGILFWVVQVILLYTHTQGVFHGHLEDTIWLRRTGL